MRCLWWAGSTEEICDRTKKVPVIAKHDPLLSKAYPASRVTQLLESNDAKQLASFLSQRFHERYLSPIQKTSAPSGFAKMAIACLMIEALESFAQGERDTKGRSKEMFVSFFNRAERFKAFADIAVEFFSSIRCGILHQAETRNGWRILLKGSLLDLTNKTINANAFLNELEKTLKADLETLANADCNGPIWKKYKTKIESVIANAAGSTNLSIT